MRNIARNWLELYPEGIRLHSGDKSHFKIKGEAFYEDPEVRHKILDFWIEEILASYPLASFQVMGIPTGGVVWAEKLVEGLKGWAPADWVVPPSSIVQYNPEEPSSRPLVILVDDVVTTGSSMVNYAPADIWCCVAVRENFLKYTLNPLLAWMRLTL